MLQHYLLLYYCCCSAVDRVAEQDGASPPLLPLTVCLAEPHTHTPHEQSIINRAISIIYRAFSMINRAIVLVRGDCILTVSSRWKYVS